MRQSFDVKGGAGVGRSHVPKIRAGLKSAGLDGLFIPHEDEYQNEYLPACNDRLAWATGFTGSAGAAFIFKKNAIVFADGRYTLQAKSQLDDAIFQREDLTNPGPFDWLGGQSLPGAKIGYDPRLVSPNALEKLEAAAEKAGAELIAEDVSTLDAAWTDRPNEPIEPITPHDVSFAGETSASKRQRLSNGLKERKIDAAVIVSPASLAWLFNIRGGDVSCTPLPLGRAILHSDGRADLFVRPEKASPDLGAHLGDEVRVRPINELERRLAKLSGKAISLDPALASAWFFKMLESASAKIVREPDPCALPRACKNAVEIAGAKRAHQRDGVALVRFLRWLDTEGQSGEVTEIEAVERLEAFREDTEALRDLSFEAIAGAGPNGAIVHYRVSQETNRKLARGS
ncbi:MAG: aminopeptidase P family N-terminal domain-containing protein, partial [Pseudomonadota bacterium]